MPNIPNVSVIMPNMPNVSVIMPNMIIASVIMPYRKKCIREGVYSGRIWKFFSFRLKLATGLVTLRSSDILTILANLMFFSAAAVIFGVIGSVVVLGILTLLLWKLLTTIHDRREYAAFLKETREAKWATVSTSPVK